MPEFFVEFSEPVTYQPDHPTVARRLQGLCVNAPDAAGATMHAIRTTRGPGSIVATLPIDEADPEKVAASRSLFGILLPVLPAGTSVVETPNA